MVGCGTPASCNDLLPIAYGKYRLDPIVGEGDFENLVSGHHHPGSERRCGLQGKPIPVEVPGFLPEEVVEDLERIQEIRGEKLVTDILGKLVKLNRKHIRQVLPLLEDPIGYATEFAERKGVSFIHLSSISQGSWNKVSLPGSLSREQNL